MKNKSATSTACVGLVFATPNCCVTKSFSARDLFFTSRTNSSGESVSSMNRFEPSSKLCEGSRTFIPMFDVKTFDASISPVRILSRFAACWSSTC